MSVPPDSLIRECFNNLIAALTDSAAVLEVLRHLGILRPILPLMGVVLGVISLLTAIEHGPALVLGRISGRLPA